MTIDAAFQTAMESQVEQMRKQLMHPRALVPRLHKVLMYRPGDFFSDHMDAAHSKDMLATLSVSLLSEGDDLKTPLIEFRESDLRVSHSLPDFDTDWCFLLGRIQMLTKFQAPV